MVNPMMRLITTQLAAVFWENKDIIQKFGYISLLQIKFCTFLHVDLFFFIDNSSRPLIFIYQHILIKKINLSFYLHFVPIVNKQAVAKCRP